MVLENSNEIKRANTMAPTYSENNTKPCGHCDLCLNGSGLKRFKPVKTTFWPKTSSNNFDQDTKITEVKVASPFATKLTQIETFGLLSQGLPINEIAGKRGLAENTIIEHICYLIDKKMPVNLDKLVEPKTQAKIIKAIEKIGVEKLKPLKEALAEEISYNDIKLVVADFKTRNTQPTKNNNSN